MTHFRNRVGSEALDKLLQESLRVAYSEGALDLKSIDKVAVDTTRSIKKYHTHILKLKYDFLTSDYLRSLKNLQN